MLRAFLMAALLAPALSCRAYDFYEPLADEAGLVPAERYARYGHEQAQAVAIGRSLAQWYGGTSAEARSTQELKAAQYARTLPGVASVVPDGQGYRLMVIFESGWRIAAVPVNDGVQPQDTPGLSGAQ